MRYPTGFATQIVDITPQLAGEMLERNTSNRPLNENRAKTYARDMRGGSWQLNGESLKFSRNGLLLDGQHRLRAIQMAERTVPMLVVFGLNDAAQATMDMGAKRSVSDILRMRGVKNYTKASAIAQGDMRWQKFGPLAAFQSGGRLVLTATETVDWYEAHAVEIDLAASPSKRLYDATNHVVSQTAAGILWLQFHRLDVDDADAFFERLIKGVASDEHDPILVLRNRLMRLAADRDAIRRLPQYKAALIVKAWNLYRTGGTCETLQWSPSGKFPKPV